MIPELDGGAVLSMTGVRYSLGERVILDDVGLSVRSGESIAVSGPSGCGKTTLLMCALGLLKPDAGVIKVAGTDIVGLSKRDLARHRRAHLGIVFQFGELLPELSPVENVALPALLAGEDHRRAYAAAEELLADLGVAVNDTPTASLSGGERQRTAVARALVGEPSVVLADEPTGALDQHAREAVADLLFSVPAARGCALVVVTHDPAVARRADRRLVLASGELAEAAR